mmetsp:Transcript_22562/g.27840  ORF Transcript_22562/g.27840 Transcript_22562/m.27840 type:complete len:324 (-) Transcript_22562:123-1094(-)|eukprot:CAMPEP_0172502666 /NCGR_PEP_ID=MMETSP1066-20121228/161788_1 /TAXON_ID=671091 /ORGANISM="Coscinodiscus wailesii, Strain CCMP2513" /LENGTH=323 /DNA_ID=CAMNT_0013278003 /DNA_START=166 /DNA_END=1137 /DNA_ORIENTATION=+
MKKPGRPGLTLIVAAIASTTSPLTEATVPLTHTIPNYQSSCLFENLSTDEHVTMSVFVTSGAELRATATIDGPVAPPEAKTGKEIDSYVIRHKHGERFGKKPSGSDGGASKSRHVDAKGNLHLTEHLDFEHVADVEPEEAFDDVWMLDDLEEMHPEHALDMAMERDQRTEGEPWETTIKIVSPGWYRACVTGSWYQIDAEVEFRKESELGFNHHAERVNTYDEKVLHDVNKDIDADEESSGTEQEMGTTRNQLKVLNHLMAGIREKQRQEKRRLEVHAAINEHSHSRMVLGSLAETVLFIFVTGLQVFTVRKWFSTGEPMLGK